MSSVTYKHQPAIHKTGGSVPLAGTSYVYTVSRVLWPEAVDDYLRSLLIGSTIHVCCGMSTIGDLRVDKFEPTAHVAWDAARLECEDLSFDTYLADPPYNGKFQWMHDVLNEAIRVARKRIICQYWFMPVNKDGYLKKAHAFELREVTVVPSLRGHEDEIVPALLDPETGQFFIVQGDEVSDEKFQVVQQAVWQPRAYFGRAQIITVFDRVDPIPAPGEPHQMRLF